MNLFSKIKENLFLIFQVALIVLLIMAFVTFVGVLFFDYVKNCISGLIGLTTKNKILTFLGIGMGGILVALQALMSYRRAKAMEETAKAQARATEEQARANENTEQGQRQERLKNAIEHLGHEKDSVRLGGAYELFHLAKDAKEGVKELHQTVLDILCAHIRQTTGENEYREAHKSKPSEEVQSMLRLLFVQEHEVFKGLRIELQGSYLNGVDLRKARLQKAILAGAYLKKAKLDRAHLQRANLVEAHLEESSFSEAGLQGATLTEACLREADLVQTHLQGAYLQKVHLQKAILHDAHLQGTDLREAHLQEANFNSAHLQGAIFYQAHLQRAVLVQAHLEGAILHDAHLQGTYLRGAQLHEAEVAGARLQGAGSGERPFIKMLFENRIRNQIGKETDLSRVVYAGGLTKEDVDSFTEGLSDKSLRWRLEPHIGIPESNGLPEDSGAVTGAYTKEDAEEWIAEYEKAMSEVPKDDN